MTWEVRPEVSTCGRFGTCSQGGVTHTDQTQELCSGVRQSSGSGSAAASQFQRQLDQMISVHNQIYICIYEHQTSKELTLSPSAAFPAFCFSLNIFYLEVGVGMNLTKQRHLVCIRGCGIFEGKSHSEIATPYSLFSQSQLSEEITYLTSFLVVPKQNIAYVHDSPNCASPSCECELLTPGLAG